MTKNAKTLKAKSNSDSRWSSKQRFTAEELSTVDAIIERYRPKPGSLIAVLEDVQDALGCLPKSIQRKISLGLRISFSEVYGVVTFYSFSPWHPGEDILKNAVSAQPAMSGGGKPYFG